MRASSGDGGSAWRRIVARGVVALLGAVALNVLIRVVATELFGVDARYEHLEWRDFISTTAGVVVLAVLFRVGLTRNEEKAPANFTKVAIIVFVLSLAGPISLLVADEAADGGVAATLALMHVGTALVAWRSLAVEGGRDAAGAMDA